MNADTNTRIKNSPTLISSCVANQNVEFVNTTKLVFLYNFCRWKLALKNVGYSKDCPLLYNWKPLNFSSKTPKGHYHKYSHVYQNLPLFLPCMTGIPKFFSTSSAMFWLRGAPPLTIIWTVEMSYLTMSGDLAKNIKRGGTKCVYETWK